MAGYLSTVESWEKFTPAWTSVLAAEPRIDSFHASEAESLRPDGQWAAIDKDVRDSKTDRLIDVIEDAKLQPVSVRMRLATHRKVMKGKVPPIWDDPYYVLFTGFTSACGELSHHFGENCGPVEFVFDNHQKFKKHGPVYYEHTRSLPYFSDFSAPKVHYENDEDFPPLQAADLLAWQVRRFLCSTEPRRKHYQRLRSDNDDKHPFFELILGPEHLAHWMIMFDDWADRLCESLGVQRGTRPWKKD